MELREMAVRRYGEDDAVPIILNTKEACGYFTQHVRRGCISLAWNSGRGMSGSWHLTSDEAQRLADLLHAMVDTNGASQGD